MDLPALHRGVKIQDSIKDLERIQEVLARHKNANEDPAELLVEFFTSMGNVSNSGKKKELADACLSHMITLCANEVERLQNEFAGL